MDKLFIMLSSQDRLVHEEMTFMYAFNSLKLGWWEKVRVIFWGPSQQLIIKDKPLQEYLKKMQDIGVEIWACKQCSNDLGVTEDLENLGIRVDYVGALLTGMLKDGWKQLTF